MMIMTMRIVFLWAILINAASALGQDRSEVLPLTEYKLAGDAAAPPKQSSAGRTSTAALPQGQQGGGGGQATSSAVSDVAKDAVDPTASLMSFGFRDIVTTNYYGRSGSANQIQFQPAVPFTAWGKANILRITLPYNTGGVPAKGLSDVQIFNVTVFRVKGGRLGVGPVINMVSNPASTTDRIQAGPAVGYVGGKGKWTLGVFNQNLFSGDTQITAIQPLVAYQLGKGWALAAGDAQWTVDWNTSRFVNVPLGIQLSKVTRIGSQIVRYVVNPEYNAISVTGTPHWTLRFGFQLLVPR